jgi:CheY-like chemotaxis protein
VKQSGGNATIYSELGRGTTVNLYLPRHSAHDARAISEPTPAPPIGSGETVLVVEDNAELRALTLDRLQRLGYHVIEADCGPTALAKLNVGEKIDLIFSDVVMPGGLTGYELAARAREQFPAIRILLTSGYEANLAAEQDTTGSNLKVLRKPYRQADLGHAVREALDR